MNILSQTSHDPSAMIRYNIDGVGKLHAQNTKYKAAGE
ncbi:hypothetical protein E6C60_3466 [Paenibacillus algicola]|uniref:Uncharacterized protein n=1 Tax=Paenibacillus algicola TaxID=2565926 RepID=A0A4P8XMV2_9BACL|nr:hypothetical protein E6C60_3466 [Paenibacillus algicola]